MPSEQLIKLGTLTAMTITLASLASSSTFAGQQSDEVDNTTVKAGAALIHVQVTTGTSPTANRTFYVRLIRSNNDSTPMRDDGAGASNAALTCLNAELLGTIEMNSGSSNVTFRKSFDTSKLGPLGPKWAIQISHDTGAALNSTGSNHKVTYQTYNPEQQ